MFSYVAHSFLYQKLGLLQECIRDCNRAISIFPAYVKVGEQILVLVCFICYDLLEGLYKKHMIMKGRLLVKKKHDYLS